MDPLRVREGGIDFSENQFWIFLTNAMFFVFKVMSSDFEVFFSRSNLFISGIFKDFVSGEYSPPLPTYRKCSVLSTVYNYATVLPKLDELVSPILQLSLS